MDILGRISTTKEHLRPAEQAVATAILADPDAASAATTATMITASLCMASTHEMSVSGFA